MMELYISSHWRKMSFKKEQNQQYVDYCICMCSQSCYLLAKDFSVQQATRQHCHCQHQLCRMLTVILIPVNR